MKLRDSEDGIPLRGTSIHSGGSINTPSHYLLLVTSCWVSYGGLASHPGGKVILLVTSGGGGGDINTPSHFMMGIL